MVRFERGSVVAQRYVVEGKLASGGMASVYRATMRLARGLERPVALKRVHPHLAEDAEFVTMFVDEARLASQLSHAGVVPVLDALEVEGELILVLDYAPGWDLDAVLRADAVAPVGVATRIACLCLETLSYVHRAADAGGRPLSIVHRDVSPSNVLLTSDGTVRVLDFGVAKAARRSTRTATRTLKGKLAYMSPEQARGLPLNGRSDVYAVGLVLYEMLSGRRANAATGEGALLEAAKAPAWPPLERAVPPAVRDALAQMLAPDPADRVDADDAARALAPHMADAAAQRAWVGGAMGGDARQLDSTSSAVDRALAGLLDEGPGTAARPPGTAVRPRGTAARSLLGSPATGLTADASSGPALGEPAAETRKVTPSARAAEPRKTLPRVAHDSAPASPPGGDAPISAAPNPPPNPPPLASNEPDGPPAETLREEGAAPKRRRRGIAAGAIVMGIAALAVGGVVASGVLDDGGSDVDVGRVAPPGPAPAPAFMRVRTEPPGARVRVDGVMHPQRTPTVIEVPPDQNIEVDLELDDHEPLHTTGRGASGQTTPLERTLERLPGHLDVRSDPPGAMVTLDGEALGTTPLVRDGLPRTARALTVALEGHERVEQQLDFETQREQVIAITLDATVSLGSVWVNADVQRVRVEVDGRRVADAVPWRGSLSPGRHLIRVRDASGRTAERAVTVRAGRTERVGLFIGG